MGIDKNYNLIASCPARWIDRLLLICPTYKHALRSPKKMGARLLSFAINATVFPLFLTLDTVHYSGKAVWYKLKSIFPLKCNANPTYQEHVKKVEVLALKCLRAICTWGNGFIWPDIVTNHFLPNNLADGKIHPKGNCYAMAADIRRPKDKEEVQTYVREAKNRKKSISIAGAGYSQGKQTLPNREGDIHLNMSAINHVTIDVERKIAKVGAGATWQQIQNRADAVKLAVQVMQASNVFSVGGSLSANCHGWDHTKSVLGNTVTSLTIVNAEGELQVLTPKDKQFRYVVGGYGMFGVIVEVELQLTDNQELFDYAEPVPIDKYPEYFAHEIENNPHIVMHLYRLSLVPGQLLQRGWAQSYSPKHKGKYTSDLQREPAHGTVRDKILMQIARNSILTRRFYWNSIEKDLQQVKTGTRNQIMCPPILAAFENNSGAHSEWLQEYFVSREDLPAFIKFLGGVLDRNEVTLLNASVRYVKQDTIAELGYAAEGDRFALVLFFTQSLNREEIEKTRAWVREVINYLTKIKGTFYLPYAHLATKEQFQACYPRWKNVEAAKLEFDPEQRFDNGLFQDYFTRM